MPIKYEVTAITGSYQKDGQEKRKYERVGSVIEKDGNFYLKIDKLAFNDEGNIVNFFSLYLPKAKESQAPKAQQAIQQPGADFEDDDLNW
jgi:hypothetical protein